MHRDIQTAELACLLGTDDAPLVLDVRDPDEFSRWSIPGAVNIPAGELGERLTELPGDREVVTVCDSGRRSAQAVRVLDAAGLRAADLLGGMQAWGRTYDDVALEAGGARVVQVRRRGKGCLSYLVGAGDRAFVVDPSADVEVYLGLARAHGWQVERIFDTHLHADHLSGARALRDATGATLHLNPADTFDFDYEPLADGQGFELPGGPGLAVRAVHAPGHTRGSTTYLVDGAALLTGDTLFVESVGRPDLADRAEAFAGALYTTLHQKILVLPDSVLVMPGHYGDTVTVRPDDPVAAALGELRRHLDPLGYDEAAFVAWAAGRSTVKPPNYHAIIEANMGRTDAPLDTLRDLESGPNHCAVAR